jgi:AGZA family xanthine/uracil permease-like MFS transporter
MSDAKTKRNHDIIAGFATFVAMSYIIFANPSVLEPIGMAAGPVLLWTCVIAFAGTAVAAIALDTPTALACGMGLNLFLAHYSTQQGVPWERLLATCAIVSVLVFVLSLIPARRGIIRAVPPQIFAAVKAAVGSLLVKFSLSDIADVASTKAGNATEPFGFKTAIFVFTVGIIVIIFIKALCAKYVATHSTDETQAALAKEKVQLPDSSSIIISVIVMIPICWWLQLSQQMTPTQGLYSIWQGPGAPLDQLKEWKDWGTCLAFGLAVFFIMMMDIAGSPIEYAREGNPGETLSNDKKEAIAKHSLWIDSGFNILAPLAGVSPVVFYAENHVGWKAGGRSGWTAGAAAAGFLVFALVGAVSIWLGRPISEWIPKFAIMPALFFVGLTVMAESFVRRSSPAAKGDITQTDQLKTPLGRALFFFPAALTVVIVTITFSFDVAIAAGILAYALISLLPKAYIGEEAEPAEGPNPLNATERHARLSPIYVGAAVVLFANFMLLK